MAGWLVARWLGAEVWVAGGWWLGGWWLVAGGCSPQTHTYTRTQTINTEKKELIYFLDGPWGIKFLEKMESYSQNFQKPLVGRVVYF